MIPVGTRAVSLRKQRIGSLEHCQSMAVADVNRRKGIMLSKLKGFFAPTVSTDDTLAKVDELLPLPDGSSSEARYLLIKLTPWSEDEGLNAKTRRRVKRIVSRLNEVYPGLDLSAPIVEESPSVASTRMHATYGDLDATTAAGHFRVAKSASEVEGILNCLVGPSGESKTATDWQTLKEVLFTVMANRHVTNKNIRRRISRLIFVIASDSDLKKLNELKKESQEVAASVSANRTRAQRESTSQQQQTGLKTAPLQSRSAPPPTAAPTVQLAGKSIDECLAELRKAAGAAEVDSAISAVSAGSQGSAAARAELRTTLAVLAEDATMVSNTKVKRKVLRLIKTLEGMDQSQSQGQEEEKPSSFAIPAKKAGAAVKVPTKLVAVSAAATASTVVGDAGGIEGIVRQLKDVHSAEQLDAVLVTLDMRTVLPPEASAAAEERADKPPTSSAQHRKLLKRTIEQVLAQDDVSATMNAKVRRRVSRITGALATDSDDNAGAEIGVTTSSDAAAVGSDPRSTGMGLVIPSTGTIVNAPVKKVPYVVFVGNLSYDTTATDIETHLRQTAALEGPIKVRLRTDAATKQSTGVAFVDLEGARELHQCIAAAHHSTLHGRIINVEKSCGGRNKAQRGEKIVAKRSEQQARAEEAVNRVLAQFEQRGVLQAVHKWGPTLKEGVYAHSPAHLTQVLEAYSGLPKPEQRISTLLQLLTDRKHSGSAAMHVAE